MSKDKVVDLRTRRGVPPTDQPQENMEAFVQLDEKFVDAVVQWYNLYREQVGKVIGAFKQMANAKTEKQMEKWQVNLIAEMAALDLLQQRSPKKIVKLTALNVLPPKQD